MVQRLNAAGAVLVAKSTTGEMAFGDQWAGGRTNNPWNLAEGSSGSSAGSAAATAAGLVGFAIGTDTGGSILSPAVRCGIVGLRPTFGRVSRFGVMAAGTTLDKVGPMCRHAQDCAIVLQAIAGADEMDLAVRDVPISFDATAGRYPKRIGYVPAMMDAETDADQRANNARALAMLKRLGCTHARGHAARVATSATSSSTSSARRRSRASPRRDCTAAAAAHQPLFARGSAGDRGGLPAGESPARGDHAGRGAGDGGRRRGDVHVADARFAHQLESGDEPDRTSVDCGPERISIERLTGRRDVHRPLYREGDVIALAKAWQDGLEDPARRPPLFGAR